MKGELSQPLKDHHTMVKIWNCYIAIDGRLKVLLYLWGRGDNLWHVHLKASPYKFPPKLYMNTVEPLYFRGSFCKGVFYFRGACPYEGVSLYVRTVVNMHWISFKIQKEFVTERGRIMCQFKCYSDEFQNFCCYDISVNALSTIVL